MTQTISTQKKRLRRYIIAFFAACTVVTGTIRPVLADLYSDNGVEFYNLHGDQLQSCGSTSAPGGPTLDGFALPASKGKTGAEEPVNDAGQVPSTGHPVTFSGFAHLGQAYRDYYITMRWTYAAWNWDGTAKIVDSKQVDWLRSKPRLVLVTNPRTNKSIIADIMEAGPAPWVGVDHGPSNTPKEGWNNPQVGTPTTYTGLVSGFPPPAISALGAVTGYLGQNGDALLYSWAPDQNATPGPTQLVASGGVNSGVTSGPSTCGGANGSLGVANGFTFPMLVTQSIVKKGVNGSTWCYTDQNSCHHDYKAADIIVPTGTTNVAAKAGTVLIVDQGSPPGTVSEGATVNIVGDDNTTYYYAHMGYRTIKVRAGQKVTAGQPLGNVGLASDAAGTIPHLHFDMLPGRFPRPACAGPACTGYPFINPQTYLIPAFNALPQ